MRQLIIYGKLPDRIFLFKIPISVRQDLFETYSQFGQAPQNVSSALLNDLRRTLFYLFSTRNMQLFHSGHRRIPATPCKSVVSCAGSDLATS